MDEKATNPWAVPNIMAFNYFLCPECDFQAKTPPLFENHAIENHPRAKSLFEQVQASTIKSEQEALEDLLKSADAQLKQEEPDNSYYFDIGLGEDDHEGEKGDEGYFFCLLRFLAIYVKSLSPTFFVQQLIVLK